MFLTSFPRGPQTLHHRLITLQSVTLIPMSWCPCLGGLQEVSNGPASFEIHLDSFLLQMLIKLLSNPLMYGTTIWILLSLL